MTERTVMVANTLGIHARPASQIVQTATKFDARMSLERDGISADAKSIMSVMMLAAAHNTTVTIRAWGRDEKDAVETLAALFAAKFNEE
jgi:phosphocarrier protein HPr